MTPELTPQERIHQLEAELAALKAQATAQPSTPPPLATPMDAILQARQVSVAQDASGNVIVTGDNNTISLTPDEAPALLLKLYLHSLAEDCSRLPLGLVNEEFTRPGVPGQVRLQNVYTDLDVTSPPQPEAGEDDLPGQARWFGLRLERGDLGDRVALLEAISQPEFPCLALVGGPGSGKTTFVNYIVSRLAAGDDQSLPTALRKLIPIRLELRRAASKIPLEAGCGTAAMLWQALEADIARYRGQAVANQVLPYLQRQLYRQGGLVLLDGLDEVPEAGQRRKCLLEAIQAWQADLPRCRFLLTARPYAYADPRWQLPGFRILALAPFNQRQIDGFVQRWYQAVRTSQGWDEDNAAARGQELLGALELRPDLGDLASRPLLLTLMATLHSHKSRMPEDRAELYEFSVGLLLSRWQVGRQEKDEQGNWVIEPGIERVVGLGETRLRAALEELALQVHQRQGESETGRQEASQNAPADASLGEVLTIFSKQAPHDLNATLLVKYLEERAGLLVGRGNDLYTFPHRSFQEYLAVCRLANTAPDFAQELCERVAQDLNWWREVFLLGVGKKRMGGMSGAVDLLNRLRPCNPADVKTLSDYDWRAAILAGEAALELRLPQEAENNEYYRIVLDRLRSWLRALIEGGYLPLRERLQAGDILGKLGDPRLGVGLCSFPPLPGLGEGSGVRAEVPDIAWVHLPAGSFLLGSADDDKQAYADEKPQHTLKLPDFWLSRYPVTKAQYRPFVESGGYNQERFWTPEGWAWRQGAEPDFSPFDNYPDKDFIQRYKKWISGRAERSQPNWWDHPQWGAATRPVVGVTWYEALAYTHWLTETLINARASIPAGLPTGQWRISLPSEAEWEYAAKGRGDGTRIYPWGHDWQENCANTKEAELGETSPVGIFPAGASPDGIHDLSGNVWEWTRSKWGLDVMKVGYPYPYQPDDGREALDGSDARVLRGGSWGDDSRSARCACRNRNIPADFLSDIGFRVLLSPSASSGQALADPGF